MSTENKSVTVEKDEFDEFDEQIAKKEAEFIKVTYEIPKGMDPTSVQAIMKKMEQVTADQIKKDKTVSIGRKQYIEDSKIRYVCEISSNRTGWPDFEMVISNPENDRPVILRGLCGVLLEEGLTKYALDRLREAHEWHSVKGWSMSPADIMQVDSAMVLTHKKQKRRLYSVLVYDEVDNPIPVGQKIGQAKKKAR